MDKHDKLVESLVLDYLKRIEKNSSVLFSVNRSPVSVKIIREILFLFINWFEIHLGVLLFCPGLIKIIFFLSKGNVG